MTQSFSLSWDYSALASTYDLRADYNSQLVHEVLQTLNLRPGDATLEIGAGTGKLTSILCDFGLTVTAVEPNHNMRDIALAKPALNRAQWLAARGEALPVAPNSTMLVAYGSSFNVLPAQQTLKECARVLRPGGHWLALWNHRDLDDPLQQAVEVLIRHHIPGYDYGSRRKSPLDEVNAHGAFAGLQAHERRFTVRTSTADWLQAWRSHATLQRQASAQLQPILNELSILVGNSSMLEIPYFTRIWTAQRQPT